MMTNTKHKLKKINKISCKVGKLFLDSYFLNTPL